MRFSHWKRVLALPVLLALAGTPALGQQAPAEPNAAEQKSGQQKPREVNPVIAENLVKYTIIAVDQANRTGNYTVLRGLGTPRFQQTTSAAMLARSFARMRQMRLELSTVLLVKPSFTKPPILDKGVLKVAGVFPTTPTNIAFEATYVNVGGRMRVAGLRITPVKAAVEGKTNSEGKVDKKP